MVGSMTGSGWLWGGGELGLAPLVNTRASARIVLTDASSSPGGLPADSGGTVPEPAPGLQPAKRRLDLG